MTRLRAIWARARGHAVREDGAATIGLVLMLPMFMYVFMASFEIGLYMTRLTLLDRALDITARDIRLGKVANPTHDNIKAIVCANASMVPDCMTSLKLSLERVETTTWTLPATQATCVNRAEEVDPVTALDPNPTERKVLMIMRGCVIADALFPSIGVAAALPLDGKGGYKLIATSAFLNEP